MGRLCNSIDRVPNFDQEHQAESSFQCCSAEAWISALRILARQSLKAWLCLRMAASPQNEPVGVSSKLVSLWPSRFKDPPDCVPAPRWVKLVGAIVVIQDLDRLEFDLIVAKRTNETHATKLHTLSRITKIQIPN